MRREQHVKAVEQLDVGAYGYLMSRTAVLHPQGEMFDLSMGLRGLFEALTKIAAQPEKDFGELVRQWRRKRGLAVAPAGKILPFLPAGPDDALAERAALDAAEQILHGTLQGNKVQAARKRLAEWRLREAFTALEQAKLCDDTPKRLARLETLYQQALVTYEAICW
jgi:hypothetical protein